MNITNDLIKRVNNDLAFRLRVRKLIPNPEIKEILKKANAENKRIDKILLESGRIADDPMNAVYSSYLGYEIANIDMVTVDEKIVRTVTDSFIEKYKAIPLNYDKQGRKYLIAVGDPFSIVSLNIMRALFGADSRFIISDYPKIEKIKTKVFSGIDIAEAISAYDGSTTRADSDVNLEDADIYDSPAVKLVESCIRDAVVKGASDIHIEPYEKIVRIRYRIDGMLYENTSFGIKMFPAVCTRVKILAEMNIAERRIPQDGRIKQTIEAKEYDFRVSTLPTVYGEKIVIRILDTTAFNYVRSELGFLPEENRKIDILLKKPHGIILLTGPTGCGKSTTLYSFIKEINSENVNIITVEDPVEYSISGINQVQVNPKANLTFARALRSILRQDPNIVMIGEIRDEETAEIAMRMAITGHLVLSTLHTNDAPGAVMRLMDLGLEPYFVTDALVGVISQRLVRRLCPDCKKEHLSLKSENDILRLAKSRKIFEPIGCPACHYTGYRGRLGVHEILVLDDDLKEMIGRNTSTSEIRKKALENGMLDLYTTCRQAVLDGKTSIGELLSVMYEKN